MSTNDASDEPCESGFDPLDFMITTTTARLDQGFTFTGKASQTSLLRDDDNELMSPSMGPEAFFWVRTQVEGLGPDPERFLLDLTRQAHELRHFFDLVSTTTGYLIFRANWASLVSFHSLLEECAAQGESLKIPIERWIRRGDSLEQTRDFFDEYRAAREYVSDLYEEWVELEERPLGEFPAEYRTYLSGLRVPREKGYRPCLSIPDPPSMVISPIRVMDLFEAAAWNQQLIAMNRIGGEAALKYWQAFRKRIRKPYVPPLLAAFFACKGEREDMSKMLEFAWLGPLPVNGRPDPKLDAMQYDPSWRYYTLWQHMIQSNCPNADTAVERLCKEKKWVYPKEVVRDLHRHVATWRKEVARGNEHTDLQLVMQDYLDYFERMMAAREKKPLFGGPDDKNYMKLVDGNPPPLHRLLLNGKTYFTDNPKVHASAWRSFFEMSHMMRGAVEGQSLKCWYSLKQPPPRVLPGNGRCICELERDQCHIAQHLEKLGVKVETLGR